MVQVFCFQFFTYKEGFGFDFCGGRQPPCSGVFSFVFSELSTGSSLLLLVLLLLVLLLLVYVPRMLEESGGNVPRMLEDRVCECSPYARGKLPRFTQPCGKPTIYALRALREVGKP